MMVKNKLMGDEMRALSPLTRAILQLARWGIEREQREAGNVDELAGTATSPASDGSEEHVSASVAEGGDTASQRPSVRREGSLEGL